MKNIQTSSQSPIEAKVYAKVLWRLVPFLFLCYVVAYLDRVNVGFAKLQMLSDLQFSEAVYGLGAGIFFIGYFLFEVPSNIILHKTGARIWIARIMITWGVISVAMMLVNSPEVFYFLRFFLGAAEAGFFPGIILYLTYWFPSERRGRVIALFMTAVALSGVIGGPLSGWIMQVFEGVNGWSSWQWLFLLEGIPSILMGVCVFFYLDDSIDAAKWLTQNEKKFLKERIQNDQTEASDHGIMHTFKNSKVWVLATIYFCFVMGLYGVSFWLPQLIKSMGVKNVLDIGLLTAIPYGVATVMMILVSRSSDRMGERRWHTAIASILGGVGLIFAGVFSDSELLGMIALSIATAGILTSLPLFWTIPTAFLGGASAATGIAMINSLGNLAGFVSPMMVGSIKEATGSPTLGLYVIAVTLFMGALIVILAIKKPAVS